MNFPAEETKSGWLTKLGGNSLRKTWKRRWFVLKGSCLYYFRSQNDQEPAGIIPLVSYNTVTHDSTVTKKSEFCIRIEKVHRSSDSVSSSNSMRDAKNPPTFIAFTDTESEMHSWLTILQRRVGERNIVDIVLDRLDLTTSLGHRRKGSIGSLRSFYSRNGSTNGTSSSLSSRRPSLDSLSLDAPSLDSRKSSMDSVPGQHSDGAASQQSSRSATPNSLVATFGLSAPILRKTVSTSCMHDRRTCKPTTQTRSVAPAIKEEQQQQHQQQQSGAPLIMVHNDDSGKLSSSPEAVIFPDNVVSGSPGSPATPMSNLFPSHLSDEN